MKTFAEFLETELEKATELLLKHDRNKLDNLLSYSGAESLSELMSVIEKDDLMRAEILANADKVFAQLRAYLITTYGDVSVSRRNYMYELSNSIGEHRSPLACDTPYPKDIPDSCNIEVFMRACDRETLIRSYMLIPEQSMAKIPTTAYQYSFVESNLRSILRVCYILERGGAALCGFGVGNIYGGGEHSVIDGVIDDSLEANIENIKKHII